MSTIILTRPTLTDLGRWVAQHEWLCQALALLTVVGELFFFTSLFSKWARAIFVPLVFGMHLGTYFILGAHGAFFTYLLCYVFWVPWRKIPLKLRSTPLRIVVVGPIVWLIAWTSDLNYYLVFPLYLVTEYILLLRKDVDTLRFTCWVFIFPVVLWELFHPFANSIFIGALAYAWFPFMLIWFLQKPPIQWRFKKKPSAIQTAGASLLARFVIPVILLTALGLIAPFSGFQNAGMSEYSMVEIGFALMLIGIRVTMSGAYFSNGIKSVLPYVFALSVAGLVAIFRDNIGPSDIGIMGQTFILQMYLFVEIVYHIRQWHFGKQEENTSTKISDA